MIPPFTEQRKLSLTRIERGVGGSGAQLSKRTSTLVSSLRNRRLTGPQLAASLNSTRLNVNSEDATPGCGLLGRVANKKPYLRLANKKKRLRWAKEQTLDRGSLPRRPASRRRLFTVDVETGVLRVLFNEAAS